MRHETFASGRSRIAPMPAFVVPAEFAARKDDLEAIDAAARVMVETMIVEMQDGEPEIDVVGTLWARVERYTRNGLGWLAGVNRDLAMAMQLDPRLAVVEQMYARAEGAVIEARRSGTEVRDDRMLIDAYGRMIRSQATAARRAA